MSREMHEFEVTIEHATDRGILVGYEGREIWLPESQIEYNETELESVMNTGKEITIEVPGWLAEDKEMI